MYITNLCNAKKDLAKLIESCLIFDEEITICGKNGNVVMINEDRYNSLVESLRLARVPGVYQDIKNVEKTPIDKLSKDCPWQ